MFIVVAAAVVMLLADPPLADHAGAERDAVSVRRAQIESELGAAIGPHVPADHWSRGWAGTYVRGGVLTWDVLKISRTAGVVVIGHGCTGEWGLHQGDVAGTIDGGVSINWSDKAAGAVRSRDIGSRMYFITWGAKRLFMSEADLVSLVNNLNTGRSDLSARRLWQWSPDGGPQPTYDEVPGVQPDLPASWHGRLFEHRVELAATGVDPGVTTGEGPDRTTAFPVTLRGGRDVGAWIGMAVPWQDAHESGSLVIDEVDDATSRGRVVVAGVPANPPASGQVFGVPGTSLPGRNEANDVESRRPGFVERRERIRSEIGAIPASSLAPDHWTRAWAGTYRTILQARGKQGELLIAPDAGATFEYLREEQRINHGPITETIPSGVVIDWAADPSIGATPVISRWMYFVTWGDKTLVGSESSLLALVNTLNEGGSGMSVLPDFFQRTTADGNLGPGAMERPIVRPVLPPEWSRRLFDHRFELRTTGTGEVTHTITQSQRETVVRVTLDTGADRGAFVGMTFPFQRGTAQGRLELDKVGPMTSEGVLRVWSHASSALEPPKPGDVFALPGTSLPEARK